VDGKPRLEGTSSFLESRGISLPAGSPSDPPGTHTVHGLSNQKNDLVLAVLQRDGVEVYPGSSRYIAAVRAAGLRTAIVSSSANTADVLEAGGVSESPRRTRFSRPPACWAPRLARQPSSRTRWQAWQPDTPADSGSW